MTAVATLSCMSGQAEEIVVKGLPFAQVAVVTGGDYVGSVE